VDTSKRSDDDGESTEVTGFEGCMFTRGTFAVVVVPDNNPFDAMVTIVGSNFGDSTPFASDLVFDFVSLAVLGINGTNQAVFCKEEIKNDWL
jgi:hypothetical protein